VSSRLLSDWGAQLSWIHDKYYIISNK
jgi:hypothetical protein